MPTGRWIPTEGCTCWRCRLAFWFIPLQKLGLTFSIGLLLLAVLAIFALVTGGG